MPPLLIVPKKQNSGIKDKLTAILEFWYYQSSMDYSVADPDRGCGSWPDPQPDP